MRLHVHTWLSGLQPYLWAPAAPPGPGLQAESAALRKQSGHATDEAAQVREACHCHKSCSALLHACCRRMHRPARCSSPRLLACCLCILLPPAGGGHVLHPGQRHGDRRRAGGRPGVWRCEQCGNVAFFIACLVAVRCCPAVCLPGCWAGCLPGRWAGRKQPWAARPRLVHPLRRSPAHLPAPCPPLPAAHCAPLHPFLGCPAGAGRHP